MADLTEVQIDALVEKYNVKAYPPASQKYLNKALRILVKYDCESSIPVGTINPDSQYWDLMNQFRGSLVK